MTPSGIARRAGHRDPTRRAWGGDRGNTFTYGLPDDVQLIGDWNGDGVKTPGVYRDGVVYLRNSNTSGFADIQFFYGGLFPFDFPIVGDWDGNGTDTMVSTAETK